MVLDPIFSGESHRAQIKVGGLEATVEAEEEAPLGCASSITIGALAEVAEGSKSYVKPGCGMADGWVIV